MITALLDWTTEMLTWNESLALPDPMVAARSAHCSQLSALSPGQDLRTRQFLVPVIEV